MTSTTPLQQNGTKSKIDNKATTTPTSTLATAQPQTYFKPSSLLLSASTINSLPPETNSLSGSGGGSGHGGGGSTLMSNGYINPLGKPVSSTTPGAPKTATGNGGGNNSCGTLTKQDIDYHLENFIMNRKIALNGGNELRIDEKNISLHLNNPFAVGFGVPTADGVGPTTYSTLQRNGNGVNSSIGSGMMRGPSDNSSYGTMTRPKRPHSIAVTGPSLSNDYHSQSSTMYSKEQIYSSTASIYKGSPSMRPSPLTIATTTHLKQQDFYTPPSPVPVVSLHQVNAAAASAVKPNSTPPAVPARRSQSIPRQSISSTMSSNGTAMTMARPRSLDRSDPPPPVARRIPSQFNAATLNRPGGGGMRQSQTFHGQPLRSDIYKFPNETQPMEPDKRSERPMSFAYGQVPEQVYLEHQLRLYTEQLRTITEGVRRYSEQARLLQEMKRSQQQPQLPRIPNSRSEPRLKQSTDLSIATSNDGSGTAQTPSHQLKLFLDSIRSSMREPVQENAVPEADYESEEEDDSPNSDMKRGKVPSPAPSGNTDPKTSSDQLRFFLDQIRLNQNNAQKSIKTDPSPPPLSLSLPPQPSTLRPTVKPFESLSHSPITSDSFSKVTDNLNAMSQELDNLTTTSTTLSTLRTTKHSMDQMLDNFYQVASNMKTTNSLEYLRKCSEALKQTTEQIRQLNATNKYNGNGNGNGSSGAGSGGSSSNFYDSHDDSSCSTTPGSIREAVQHLLQQPRNGFQIMDDRMSIFIDIIEAQEKFSQVRSIR